MAPRKPDRTLPRTPLRDWRERHMDVSWEELAQRAGVAVRTVKRAAAGEPVDEASAAALERETGIAASTFREGAAPPKKAQARASRATGADTDAPPRPTKAGTGGLVKVKDARVRAAVLVAAELVGDARAGETVGVEASERSVRRWRAELATDGDLARAYAKMLSGRWLAKLEVLVAKIAGRTIDLLDSKELSVDHLRDLSVLLETAGGLLVERDALLRRMSGDDDGEAEAASHREGAALRADSAGAGSLSTH